MRQLERLYHQLYPWLASLYDAESGGFYYARSAIGVEHFAPDIESTAFAVDLIEAGGLLQQMPAPVREGLIAYFQSRQDDRTGYFIDPQNEMKTMERMRGRAVKMATIALQKLGASPLHSLPGSTSGASDLDNLGLAFLKSPGALVDWIEAQPWDHSWTALDAVASQAEILASFAPERRAPLLEAAYACLEKRQEPDTGLWGGGTPYVRVSGAFKLAMFYEVFNRRIPLADRIYESTLDAMRHAACEHFCWVRNPLCLIKALEPYMAHISLDERTEISAISFRNMERFLQPDGGFSVFPERSNPAPNAVPLGLGEAEGDLNASHQAGTFVRDLIYELSGEPRPPMPNTATFYEFLPT